MKSIYNYIHACHDLALEFGTAATVAFWVAFLVTVSVLSYNIAEIIRWALYMLFDGSAPDKECLKDSDHFDKF